MSSRPPIHLNREGAPSKNRVENIAETASAKRNAWKTRASARSRCPAPSARATADETPTPIPLLVVCSTSITQGNASDAPARASVPIRPRKKPSKVMTPANASKLRMFGAARRSSVGRIGPSSSILVRAAAASEGAVFPGDDDTEIGGLWTFIGAPRPQRDLSSAWTKRLFEAGRLRNGARNASAKRGPIIRGGAPTAIDDF